MDFQPILIDDFDWSDTSTAPPEEAPPAPVREEPLPRRRPSRLEEMDQDLLPPAYREYAEKNIYKRSRPRREFQPIDIDAMYGMPGVSGEPGAYNPKDDLALTRGWKTGFGGGGESIGAAGTMASIAALPPDQQLAELLKVADETPDQTQARTTTQFTDIDGLGSALTWLGESVGQMAGSWAAAAVYGGGAGAAAGAGLGAAAGAPVGGAGALPGAVAGGLTGFTWGTLGAFGGMGVGGMFQDLLHDEGVKKGLREGTITPNEIYAWSTLGGAAIGALDAVPAFRLGKKAIGGVSTQAIKTTILNAAKRGAIKQGLEEGGTEAIQGAISEFGQAVTGGNLDLAERALSVLNQGAAGIAGGAAPGAAVEVYQNARLPAPPGQANNAVPPGTTATPPPPGGGAGPTTPATGGPGGGPSGTGTGTIATPPAGGRADSGKREQGKVPPPGTGTPVQSSTTGIDSDTEAAAAAAGYGLEQEEPDEFGSTPAGILDRIAKTGLQTDTAPKLDPDIAAATGATEGEAPEGEAAGIEAQLQQLRQERDALTAQFEERLKALQQEREAPATPAAPAVPAPPVVEAPAAPVVPETTPQVTPESVAAPSPAVTAPAGAAEEAGGAEALVPPPATINRFVTAKGSQYELHEDGTTTRNKAERPEHPGDFGPKSKSAITLFLDPQQTEDVLVAVSVGDQRMLVQEPDGSWTIMTRDPKTRKWGRAPGASGMQLATQPAMGLSPLEGLTQQGAGVFGNLHIGNQIIDMERRPEEGTPPTEGIPPSTPEPVREPEPVAVVEETVEVTPVEKEPKGEKLVRQQMLRFIAGLEPEVEIAPPPAPAQPVTMVQGEFPAAWQKGMPPKPKLRKEVPREAKAVALRERRKIQAQRAAAETERREAGRREGLVTYSVTAIADARSRLLQLARNRRRYLFFWEHLPETIQERLEEYHPDTFFEEKPAPAPERRPVARAKPPVRPTPPAPLKRAPRKPVALKPAKLPEPEVLPGAPARKFLMRLTPTLFTNMKDKARLIGKKIAGLGQITGFENGMVLVRHRLTLEQAKLLLDRMGVEKFDSFVHGLDAVSKGRKRLSVIGTFGRTMELQAPSGAKIRVPFDEVFGTYTIMADIPHDPADLFTEHAITVETREAARKPTTVPARPPSVLERLREHFRTNASPVDLKSAGFSAAEIARLEAAGMAEDGSMDPAEFGRWERSKAGIVPPVGLPRKPRVTEVTQEEKRRAWKERREERLLEKRASAEQRRALKEETRQRKMFWKGAKKKQGRKSLLREEVEHRLRTTTAIEPALAARLAEEMVAGVKGAGRAPAELRETHAEELVNKAVEKFGADLAERQRLLEETTAAIREAAETAEEESYGRRVKETGVKPAAMLEKEDPYSTWRAAKKEFARVNAGEKERTNELLYRMGEIATQISNMSRTKKDAAAFAAPIRLLRGEYNALRDQAIAGQKVVEREAAKKGRQWEARAVRARAKFQRFVTELFERGRIDQAEAEALMEAYSTTGRYAKREKRGLKTTPMLEDIFAETPAPEAVPDIEARLRKYKRKKKVYPEAKSRGELWREIVDWANQLVDKVEDQAHVNKIELPREMSRRFATPHENVYLFIKGRLQRFSEGKKQVGDNKLQRGQSLYDAWAAFNFLQRIQQKSGERAAEFWYRQQDEIKNLYNVMFDVEPGAGLPQGTQGAPIIEYAGGEEQRMEERLTAEVKQWEAERATGLPKNFASLEAAVTQAVTEEPIFPTRQEMEREFAERGWRVKGARPTRLGAPRQTAEGGAVPVETITGREAINRYLKNWEGIPGAPKGTMATIRRALINSVRQLVGDIQVDIITPEDMQARFGNLAGLYDAVPHRIYLNAAAMADPSEAAETVVEEMIHAATVYAMLRNVRGTRGIVEEIMNEVNRQFPTGTNATVDYAMDSAEEFVGHSLRNREMQTVLSGMKLNVATRARLRALAKGRTMTNMLDVFVAMIENALGVNTRSMLYALLDVYPHAAMSTADIRRHLRESPLTEAEKQELGTENLIFGRPFNLASLKPAMDKAVDARIWSRGWFNYLLAPTEHLKRRIADDFFGGVMANPINRYAEKAVQEHRRLIEKAMATGDELDNELLRWATEDYETRWPILGNALKTAVVASIERVDPRKSLKDNTWIWYDPFHPTKRKRPRPTLKHQLDTYRRKVYDKLSAEWATYPPELRDLISRRMDHMSAQMEEHDRKLLRNSLNSLMSPENAHPIVLPATMTKQQAIDELYSGKISTDLSTALGKNMETILGAIGRFGARGQPYMPAYRAGEYFMSGRQDIELPKVSRGNVVFDQKTYDDKGTYAFIFDNQADMVDYLDTMGTTMEEMVVGRPKVRYINPYTGKKVQAKEHGTVDSGPHKGKYFEAQPIYYVVMQNRFMAMSDSPAELTAMKKEMDAEGIYHELTDPIHVSEHNKLSSVQSMPLQLRTMLKNVDSMVGIDTHEKQLIRAGTITSFIKSQQGNRITKRLMRRSGVYGYETDPTAVMTSLRTNNEMMSRHNVSLDRIPEINEAFKEADNFINAARGKREAVVKLSPELQALVTREYGAVDPTKVTRLSNDFRELQHRFEATMQAQGGKMRGENLRHAVQSVVVLSYLMKPVYFAIQMLGLPMQSYPGMVKNLYKDEGVAAFGAARRYMGKGMADASILKNYGRGLAEALAEGRETLKGYRSRKAFLKHGRPLRKLHDYLPDIKDNLDAIDSKYKDVKKRLLDLAWKRGHIGQAGLEQANLRLDVMGAGVMPKIYRAVEHHMRIFRAVQEGVEINNRVAPMLGYLEFYLDKGYPEDQAMELAMNNTISEQVGYGRENWPTWMDHPLAGPALLFHKFGIQQALNFWGSMRQLAVGDRGQAIAHLLTMTLVLAAVGGFSGNPLWEPLRLLGYMLGIIENWDVAKTKGEKWMAGFLGETGAEMTMFGLPRLVGIDLSSRVALDMTLFYKQPEEMTPDAWYKVVGQMLFGAPGQTAMTTWQATSGITGDQTWPKWLSQLPLPGFMKDIFKSYDTYVNGPRTAKGVKTDKAPPLVESIVQSMGVRTRSQTRPFEQGSAAQQRVKQLTQDQKSELIQRVLNQGMTSSNMGKIRSYNRGKPLADRITIKKIHEARKRRRTLERDIRKENVRAR
jgi:hypothetical protein